MSRRAVLLLSALAAAALLLVASLGRDAPAPAARPAAPQPRPSPEAGGSAASVAPDPATIRDVFRFADRPSTAPTLARAPRRAEGPAPAAGPEPAADWPRLVGLVRRQGRLLAAFAAGGDVVLAGPGEEAMGVAVVEVGEEGVLVRRRDGATRLLALP